MAKFQCPACSEGELSRRETHDPFDPPNIATRGLHCSACGRDFPLFHGVPYLGLFTEGELLSVMEVTSFLTDFNLDSNNSPRRPDSRSSDLALDYSKIQDMVAVARSEQGDGIDFQAYGYTGAPHWFASRYNEFKQLQQTIDGFQFEGKELLDIGAGTGFDATRFRRMGARVTALEYNPLQLVVGAANFPGVDWVGGSVTRLPFPDEHFDFVVANAALHHVLNLEAGLDEMVRVLKCGGHLITMADSFGPDNMKEIDEVAIFNSHPAVLRGVNEQVPRIGRFLSPLRAHGDALAVEALTPIVHGLIPRTETMAVWPLEEAAQALSNYRGGICMRVKKTAPTTHRARPLAREVLSFADYVPCLSGRQRALARLARDIPDWALDRPIVDQDYPKFRLLLGWRQQVPGQPFREAASEAHLFVSDTHITGLFPGIQIRSPQATEADPRRLHIGLNGEEIHSEPLTSDAWVAPRIDAEGLSSSIRPMNLLTVTVSGGGSDLQSNLFQVAPPGAAAACEAYLAQSGSARRSWGRFVSLGCSAMGRIFSRGTA
jgi:ubiquinone/menaquinone biosynthesis C-methylase UbiE